MNMYTLLLAALGVASANALAADSAVLSISGTIMPAACVPSLSSPTVDFGTLRASDVLAAAAGGNYSLPDKSLTLTLTCGAPTSVALFPIDNRTPSKLPNTSYTNGLGEAPDGKAIGYYKLKFTQVWGDGEVQQLTVRGPSGSWGASQDNLLRTLTDTLYGISSKAGESPGSYRVQSYHFDLTTVIVSPSKLPLDAAVNLDGNMTFELRYL
ncbi:DUF1120 domain-containing protein [Pseudomonas sp. GZD-222]|uniref:DUF1120 domain-containing protein n=1 Tax=Pseudomonas sp. GZD-222 TaxID=3404805 RepID=UPI003BB79D54